MAESSSTEPGGTEPGSTAPGAPVKNTAEPSLNRRILALAVPAFGALIAEPIFVLTDSALIGQLGKAELAGMSIAATLVTTVVGLMNFLAYSVTPAVARAFGEKNLRRALTLTSYANYGFNLVRSLRNHRVNPREILNHELELIRRGTRHEN